MKAKEDFTYSENKNEYVIQLKKKNYWWLLLFLLLLLPLILLIRLKKDVVFKTVDIVSESALSNADVQFMYIDRRLSSQETHKLKGKTGDDGIVVFEDVKYTLFAKLFYADDKSQVIATGGCFMGDSIVPLFHSLKHKKEEILKLPARSETYDFQVVDESDRQPLPDADISMSLTVSGKNIDANSKTDPHGMSEFGNIMFCSDNIMLIASKYGYENDTINSTVKNISIDLKRRTLYLTPKTDMVKFIVKDLYSKQTVPNATAYLIVKNDTVKTTTNTNGIGKGAFDDVRIIQNMQIKVRHTAYHDTLTKSYKVSEFVEFDEKERIIYIRPKTKSYTFKNIDAETNSALAGVKNEIFVNNKSQGTQYSNNEGIFIIPELIASDKVKIIATKTGYNKNNSSINNKKVSLLAREASRQIPMTKVPPPPKNVEPPRKNCRAHFSGTLLADIPITGHISKIYTPDKYGEYVGEGEYPNNNTAFPKAVKYTFDGIAVDKGTRIILYSKENFQGTVLLDIKGPAIINNSKWKDERRIRDFKTRNFANGFQSQFPTSCRSWSKGNMNDWSKGSIKVICD